MIDLLFKMTWLEELVHRFVLSIFSTENRWSGSLEFFLYDAVKIFILLSVAVFLISYIQSYFPVERVRSSLKNVNGFVGYLVSALFGTVTPFCSCSSIPLFIGFTRARLPIGYTFAFLISSPLVDLASLILISSFFGVKVAVYYVVFGIVLAMLGGFLIDLKDWDDEIEPFVFGEEPSNLVLDSTTSFRERTAFAIDSTKEIILRVYRYVFVGVLIGSLLHNWIPTSLIEPILGSSSFFAVPLAVLIGTPVYADTFGVLPIAEGLLFHGVEVGTILAFMMAVTTVSIPSIVLLKKVIKKKLMIFFLSYVVIGIMVIGIIFNLFI